MSGGSCCRWSPPNPNGRCYGVSYLELLTELGWKLQSLERLPKPGARTFAEQNDTLTRLFG